MRCQQHQLNFTASIGCAAQNALRSTVPPRGRNGHSVELIAMQRMIRSAISGSG